jgi:hypothetical protein
MFDYTLDELHHILETYFISKDPLLLSIFPPREKKKYLCLLWMIEGFAYNQTYTEQQVNDIIKAMYHDYVTIRRAMVDYHLLDRVSDGSRYWRVLLKSDV